MQISYSVDRKYVEYVCEVRVCVLCLFVYRRVPVKDDERVCVCACVCVSYVSASVAVEVAFVTFFVVSVFRMLFLCT